MKHVFNAFDFFSVMLTQSYMAMVNFTELSLTKETHDMRSAGTSFANALATMANQTRDGFVFGRPVAELNTLRLVYFRADNEGPRDSVVEGVYKVPQYFNEVVPFVHAEEGDLALRKQIAQEHGFLILWPDEAYESPRVY